MNTAASVRYRSSLLSSLSFSSPLICQVWLYVTLLTLERLFGPPIKCLDYLAKGMPLPPAVGGPFSNAWRFFHVWSRFRFLYWGSVSGSLHVEGVGGYFTDTEGSVCGPSSWDAPEGWSCIGFQTTPIQMDRSCWVSMADVRVGNYRGNYLILIIYEINYFFFSLFLSFFSFL